MTEAGAFYDGEPKALLGKFGWLFLCNESTMNQLTGRTRLIERQLDEYKTAFRARWERFEALGLPYIFAPAPMKEVIYAEFLPDEFNITSKRLPHDQLLELFSGDPDVEITDLRPVLQKAKRSANVYVKTGTHFSAIGGHYVYSALASHPHCIELGMTPKPIEDFPMTLKAHFRGGLADKEKVTVANDRIVPADQGDPSQYSEAAVMFNLGRMGDKLISPSKVPSSYRVSETRSTRIFQRRDRKDLPSVVVVGDSFMWRVVPYLLQHCRRITCLWVPNPPFSVIEREKPDIVIQLIAERYLIRSPLMPDWELSPERPVAFEPRASG